MIVVNTDFITGKEIETVGLVKGSTIQTKNFGKDMGAGLKSIIGGELKGYTSMMNEARDIAMDRMIDDAKNMGADGIVNVRFSTSSIMNGAAEVMAYGTAVRFK
ncbi:MAG: YbjQ family protein [Clostridiales bacterium]|nr:YbjQ family protein [Clostridiales bacterium]MBS5878270.1 YbjQ family protein [Clostridiales bacterium]MDU0938916.1 YbjQ family protein [Clostridiales bacterium]MDU1041445.1 YbjQ family protein [Clostridiales bacterium]MDU3490900.1 YbjQ family protein [Clostridiales bacterium]